MIAGLFFLNGRQVALPAVMPAPDVFGVMVPVAMWAILGFEVTCTIAHLFKDPDYTIPRAFLIGFTIVAATATLFQFGVSALVPAQGMGSFPLGTAAAMYLPSLAGAQKVLMAAVYASMMGGAFSILTSNTWNLHRLALHGYMPMKSWLLKTTKRNVPWVCLIVEIAIALVVLVITEQQVPLQKMSSLGMIVAFLCAVLASFYARTKDGSRRLINPLLSLLALASTCLLGSITIYHIWKFGVSLPYVVLLGSGIVAGVWTKSREM
jgi:amino acid transporter